jgi:hypothetical protein
MLHLRPRVSKRKWLISCLAGFILLIAFSPFLFLQFVGYKDVIETNESSCIRGVFLLPKTYSVQGDFKLEYSFKDWYSVVANELCIVSTELLDENEKFDVSINFLGQYGVEILNKSIEFSTESYPNIEKVPVDEIYGVKDGIVVELDKDQKALEYYLSVEDKEVKCKKENIKLLCDLQALDLQQGFEYDLNIFSKYKSEKVKDFESFKIRTPEPIVVQSSSIAQGSTLYQELSLIKIIFNKEFNPEVNILLENDEGGNIFC